MCIFATAQSYFSGTKVEERLARGEEGINPLDSACREHDITYHTSTDTEGRYLADKKLQKEAMKRVISKDASFGERATALGVAIAMKAKKALTKKGAGLKTAGKKKTKRVAFNMLVRNARAAIKKSKPANVEATVRVAVEAVKRSKHGKQVKMPRIIKMPPRMGGSLALVPIFTGLSALGSIPGGEKGIINAINQCMLAKNEFEGQKHRGVDAIAIGNHKKGGSFYLHAGKSGKGFYLSSAKPKNQ